MEDDETFIESVVSHYVDSGLATAKDEVTMVSLDGETEVALEPLFGGVEGEQRGVRVVSNGNAVSDLSFEDRNFSDEFSRVVHGELNV